MLPGFRAVIAGIFVTVILPLVAFGIAGHFRSANGTSLSPMTPAPSTAPAEYYWSQLYAPSILHPGDSTANAEAQPGVKTARLSPQVSHIPETFRVFDTPPVVETTMEPPKSSPESSPSSFKSSKPVEPPKSVESPTSGEASKPDMVKSEPAKSEAAKPEIVKPLEQNPVETPKAEVTPETPKAPERIARLPEPVIETPAPVVPPATMADAPMLVPLAEPRDFESAASEAVAPPSVVAAAPAESPERINPATETHILTGSIPLPPKRPAPAVKHPARTSSVVHRSGTRSPTYEQPFIPLKNSLFESLFGGIRS